MANEVNKPQAIKPQVKNTNKIEVYEKNSKGEFAHKFVNKWYFEELKNRGLAYKEDGSKYE